MSAWPRALSRGSADARTGTRPSRSSSYARRREGSRESRADGRSPAWRAYGSATIPLQQEFSGTTAAAQAWGGTWYPARHSAVSGAGSRPRPSAAVSGAADLRGRPRHLPSAAARLHLPPSLDRRTRRRRREVDCQPRPPPPPGSLQGRRRGGRLEFRPGPESGPGRPRARVPTGLPRGRRRSRPSLVGGDIFGDPAVPRPALGQPAARRSSPVPRHHHSGGVRSCHAVACS